MTPTQQLPHGPGPLNGICVLVAEDDSWAAERLAVMLEEEGARLVGPCRTVADARAALARYEVDFVLVDLGLVDSFADALVSDIRARGIPFAIITGYEALPTDAYDGAVAIFLKPIERRSLISLLTKFT